MGVFIWFPGPISPGSLNLEPSLEGGSAGSQSCLACGFLNIGPGWGGGSARQPRLPPPPPTPCRCSWTLLTAWGPWPAGDCCLRKLGGQDDLGNLSCLPSLGGDRLLNVTWRWGWGIAVCHSVTPGGDATWSEEKLLCQALEGHRPLTVSGYIRPHCTGTRLRLSTRGYEVWACLC